MYKFTTFEDLCRENPSKELSISDEEIKLFHESLCEMIRTCEINKQKAQEEASKLILTH